MKSVSLQYANALADVVMAQGTAEPAAAQLRDFCSAYAESPELQNFLGSPAVSAEDRRGVIEKMAARMGASRSAWMTRTFTPESSNRYFASSDV